MAVGEKTIIQNKKARHDFYIEQTFETGIELFGTEVKSIRAGKVNLKESYAQVKDGEVFITGMHISPYEKGNIFNRDPLRTRKLLLHRREIKKLHDYIKLDGYALVPLRLYLTRGLVKCELAVAKGKKLYDKRHVQAEKSAKRDIERSFAKNS